MIKKEEGEEKVPVLVKSFIKLILKSVIVTNVNIIELLFIIRKLITS